MNTIRKSILIGMTVLGLGATTLAAQAHEGSHGDAASTAQRHAQWAEKAAARQQKLHDALKLTAAQESAWNSYVAARKPAAHGERGQRPDRAAWKAMPAPQRMEHRLAMHKQRTAAMEARLASLNTFYAVLTPEQKKVFDESSQRRGGHHHMKHHRMGA
jgi:periplasmic protein CpxP/Spy